MRFSFSLLIVAILHCLLPAISARRVKPLKVEWTLPLYVVPGEADTVQLTIHSPSFSPAEFNQLYKITATRPIWLAPDLKLRQQDDELELGEGLSRIVEFHHVNVDTDVYKIQFKLPLKWAKWAGKKFRLKIRERNHRFGGYFTRAAAVSEPILIEKDHTYQEPLTDLINEDSFEEVYYDAVPKLKNSGKRDLQQEAREVAKKYSHLRPNGGIQKHHHRPLSEKVGRLHDAARGFYEQSRRVRDDATDETQKI